jgi:hypothetical protein
MDYFVSWGGIKMTIQEVQKELYSIMCEICKSQQWGGGFSDFKLLNQDLIQLRTFTHDKETKKGLSRVIDYINGKDRSLTKIYDGLCVIKDHIDVLCKEATNEDSTVVQ